MNKKAMLLGAALSGLLLGLSGCSTTSSGPVGKCHGMNSCKGTGDCSGKGTMCAGKNQCKGQGWKKLSKLDCEEEAGTWQAKN